jgi:hypothetical protein
MINYKPVVQHNGRYRMRQLQLNNVPVGSLAITASGSTLAQWKIPALTIFNPSKSTFQYKLNFPTQGGTKINVTFEDTFESCSSIQVGSASQPGALLDLQYANNYISVARKLDTSTTDFEALDYTSGLYQSDSIKLQSGAAASGLNFFPPTTTMAAGNTFGAAIGVLYDQLTLQQPQYTRYEGLDASTAVRTRIIPFSALTHTILAMDKDMVFGEDIYINMMIAPSFKMGYAGSVNSNPVTAPLALVTQPTLTGMTVNLAVEVEPMVAASVLAKFQSGGMKFMIPFQYGWRLASAIGQISIQQQLNSGYGRWLKRIIQVPFDASETAAATVSKAYDHCNLNGVKISLYQSLLNSVPLQDQQIDVTALDDWRMNKDYIKGSVLRGYLPYAQNWFHVDNFSSPPRDDDTPFENVVEGLELTQPVTWTFNATAAVALSNYTFAEFIREVETRPGQPIEIKTV